MFEDNVEKLFSFLLVLTIMMIGLWTLVFLFRIFINYL